MGLPKTSLVDEVLGLVSEGSGNSYGKLHTTIT